MRLFYIWHESQVGPPKVALTIVRARNLTEAVDRFRTETDDLYLKHLLTLHVKACDSIYLD